MKINSLLSVGTLLCLRALSLTGMVCDQSLMLSAGSVMIIPREYVQESGWKKAQNNNCLFSSSICEAIRPYEPLSVGGFYLYSNMVMKDFIVVFVHKVERSISSSDNKAYSYTVDGTKTYKSHVQLFSKIPEEYCIFRIPTADYMNGQFDTHKKDQKHWMYDQQDKFKYETFIKRPANRRKKISLR